MIEINPHKITRAEVVVGIPSYNEADSISNVVKQIDKGIQKYFKGKSAVIINSDNNSPDNTGRVFLSTSTKTPKIYISTPPGIRGKGNNLRNLFLKIKGLRSICGMSVDADLKSITPEWIKCFLEPLARRYDCVVPIYHRDKNDATITTNLCYPLVYGLLGCNIRQPIGGDFGFSKKLVDYWLGQNWSEAVRNFGIDIFMTLNAIKSGGKLCQVDLGSKIHKPSAPKLSPMFSQTADTIFRFLSENENLWRREIDLKKPPIVCHAENKAKYEKVDIDCKEVEERALSEFRANYKFIKNHISPELCSLLEKMFLKEKSLKIDAGLWPKVVYEMFRIYHMNSNKEAIIKLLRALYFTRVASMVKENSLKTQEEAEKAIQTQAHLFFKMRGYLLMELAEGLEPPT